MFLPSDGNATPNIVHALNAQPVDGPQAVPAYPLLEVETPASHVAAVNIITPAFIHMVAQACTNMIPFAMWNVTHFSPCRRS
jgi:hypothetical protein